MFLRFFIFLFPAGLFYGDVVWPVGLFPALPWGGTFVSCREGCSPPCRGAERLSRVGGWCVIERGCRWGDAPALVGRRAARARGGVEKVVFYLKKFFLREEESK